MNNEQLKFNPMKKSFLLGIMVCLAMVANAQRSMDWYAYWGSNIAGSQIDPQRMVVDNAGYIYVAATFGGDKVAVENQTLSSNSATDNGDVVIIKLSPSKNVIWTYPLVSSGAASVADIALDGYGNLFVTGTFNGAIQVGSKSMALDESNMGEVGVYVLKLRNDGSAVRAWQIAAVGAKAGSLAIDANNNVIIVGTLDGDATFTWKGDAEGDFNNSAQLYVAKYANDGTPIWHQFRNDNGASAYGKASVAVDANNNIYVASSITGSTTFNGKALSASASNAILLAYNAAGDEQWSSMINGDEPDEAGAIVVSPIGQVIMAVNHHSGELRVDDISDVFNNGYPFVPEFVHSAFFAFDFNGEFKWFYDWGYSNIDANEPKNNGADAKCYALRCTDEGVLYASGMMTGRFGGSRLSDGTLPSGKNSGVETIDNAWLQHNTNGGWDCYLITLTRDGKLANAIRPGGTQYETGVDVALSPDKKSMYLLMQINVRDKAPYTCPDNIFDSFSDLYAPTSWASRKSNYTLLNVFCPENDGSSTNYTTAHKGKFASSLLVKYAMPEITPNVLPNFTVGAAYNQALSIANPQGQDTIVSISKYADVSFNDNVVSGTFNNDNDRYVGILAVDRIALPGEIKYYEYDAATHYSIRSNPRNLRYMALTIAKEAPVVEEDPDQPLEPFVPADAEEGIEQINAEKIRGQKVIVDGIFYFERNGRIYNAQGAQVK